MATHADWDELVRSHSNAIVPRTAWEKKLTVNHQPFAALIRSYELPLEGSSIAASL
jgi:hypothetical protein